MLLELHQALLLNELAQLGWREALLPEDLLELGQGGREEVREGGFQVFHPLGVEPHGGLGAQFGAKGALERKRIRLKVCWMKGSTPELVDRLASVYKMSKRLG